MMEIQLEEMDETEPVSLKLIGLELSVTYRQQVYVLIFEVMVK
jgi:hypothetical protein